MGEPKGKTPATATDSSPASGAPGPKEELCADGVMSVDDAMGFTSLSRTELYDRMKDGRLAWLKMGKRRLIPKRALIAMLAANVVEAE